MIQRLQTIFLIELIFLGLSLLFVPCQTIITQTGGTNVYLLPSTGFSSTHGHTVAIAINVVGLLLSAITIFLFKKRELQIKLCYALMLLWLVLSSMMLFCPFVVMEEAINTIQINYFVVAIGLFALLAAYLAVRFIKKDIDLLKSADRIR